MKKIFIKTYGCALNQSDSELMAGLLEKSGKYKIVSSIKESDLVIINSCTVKQKAETHFLKDIKKIKQMKILAGCVPQAELDKKKFKDYSIIGTSQLTKVVEVADETLKGNVIQYLEKNKNPRLNLPKIRRNSIIEIVPASEGCLGECSYCKVKQARGHLYSYEQEAIIKQIRSALTEGIKEIWLTSQDMGCYGLDINTNLVELLKKAVALEGDFLIRIGMINPNHLIKFLKDLIKIYNSPKIFKFLHIPVQSGDNEILGLMNRKYSVNEFKDIIDRFRNEIRDITISTDIICGFPGETENQFNKSLELIHDIKPDILNISRFWPRPGTKASFMVRQIHGNITKKRSRLMTRVFNKIAYQNNKKWINWKGKVLIDEHGKENSFIGRNYAYKPVVVKGNHKLGEIVNVKIKRVTSYDLRA